MPVSLPMRPFRISLCSPSTASLAMATGGVLYRVAFSPDGKRIASADWSKVRVWDSNTDETLLTLTGIHSALDVAFSPDGKYLAESYFSASPTNSNSALVGGSS